jgi:hypothetical protein
MACVVYKLFGSLPEADVGRSFDWEEALVNAGNQTTESGLIADVRRRAPTQVGASAPRGLRIQPNVLSHGSSSAKKRNERNWKNRKLLPQAGDFLRWLAENTGILPIGPRLPTWRPLGTSPGGDKPRRGVHDLVLRFLVS